MNGLYVSAWYDLWAPKEAQSAIFPPPGQQTPEWLGKYQKKQAEKWWPLIKAAGIKAQ